MAVDLTPKTQFTAEDAETAEKNERKRILYDEPHKRHEHGKYFSHGLTLINTDKIIKQKRGILK